MIGERRRGRQTYIVGSVLVYLAAVVTLALLDVRLSPILIAGGVAAVASLVAWADVHGPVLRDPDWPAGPVSRRGLTRGSDHLTDALARRLAEAPRAPADTRAILVADIRAQLIPVIAARSERAYGLDPTSDDRLLPLLSPRLAAVVLGTDGEQLLDPAYLDLVLDDLELVADDTSSPRTAP